MFELELCLDPETYRDCRSGLRPIPLPILASERDEILVTEDRPGASLRWFVVRLVADGIQAISPAWPPVAASDPSRKELTRMEIEPEPEPIKVRLNGGPMEVDLKVNIKKEAIWITLDCNAVRLSALVSPSDAARLALALQAASKAAGRRGDHA